MLHTFSYLSTEKELRCLKKQLHGPLTRLLLKRDPPLSIAEMKLSGSPLYKASVISCFKIYFVHKFV